MAVHVLRNICLIISFTIYVLYFCNVCPESVLPARLRQHQSGWVQDETEATSCNAAKPIARPSLADMLPKVGMCCFRWSMGWLVARLQKQV